MTGDGTVLVVGGTGMLGGQVVDALLSRGKHVRALVRPSSDATRLEAAGAQIARGDMMDLDSLVRAMDGADAVITTAAGYTRHSKGDTPEIDTIGNSNLAEAASRTGVRRFVLTSILTCDQTPHVPHFWHKKLAEDRLEELGVPFVALRPGRVPRPDHPDGRRPVRQGPADVVRARRDPADLRAHLRPGRLPGRRRRRRRGRRAAHRHRLGPAGQHAGGRRDLRPAPRKADPGAVRPGAG